MDGRARKLKTDDGFLALPFAEQFLIWAARIWLASVAQGRRVPAVLQEGLCAAGVPEAWEPLDAVLWLLCRHAERMPDFHGVRCLCIGRDERMLIRAVAAAQRGDAFAVRRELESLLPRDIGAAAAARLQDVGHLFLCAGLRLSAPICRRASAPGFAEAPLASRHAMASRTIH